MARFRDVTPAEAAALLAEGRSVFGKLNDVAIQVLRPIDPRVSRYLKLVGRKVWPGGTVIYVASPVFDQERHQGVNAANLEAYFVREG